MTRAHWIRVANLAWLTAVWVLLWGTVSVANVLGGLVVALVVTWLLPLPRVPVEGRVHPISVIELLAVVLWYSVLSAAQVAWAAVRPGPPPITGVLRHRVAIKSDLVLTLFIDALTVVPGTLVLEVDRRRRQVYIHVLDIGSEKAVAQFRTVVARYERFFIDAFERPEDWQPSAWQDVALRPRRWNRAGWAHARRRRTEHNQRLRRPTRKSP